MYLFICPLTADQTWMAKKVFLASEMEFSMKTQWFPQRLAKNCGFTLSKYGFLPLPGSVTIF